MTGLVTLMDPPIRPAAPPDEPALPAVDEDGKPLDWTHRQTSGLRFARWRAQRGDFDGDRFGLAPEPMPPVLRKVEP